MLFHPPELFKALSCSQTASLWGWRMGKLTDPWDGSAQATSQQLEEGEDEQSPACQHFSAPVVSGLGSGVRWAHNVPLVAFKGLPKSQRLLHLFPKRFPFFPEEAASLISLTYPFALQLPLQHRDGCTSVILPFLANPTNFWSKCP